MKRRLARAILVCHVALLAVVAAFWVRSYFRVDWLTHAQPGRQSSVTSRQGQLVLDTMGDAHVPRWPGLRGWTYAVEPIDDDEVLFAYHPGVADRSRTFLGFAYTDVGSIGMPTRRIAMLVIPYWAIALALSIVPAAALARARRRRWNQRNRRCLGCGYDLRASTDRCPECGREIEPPHDDGTNANGTNANAARVPLPP